MLAFMSGDQTWKRKIRLRTQASMYLIYYESFHDQARQTRPNSGGVEEGQPRFDKGGVAIILYFLRGKNRILEFLRKAIKKDSHLRNFTPQNVYFLEFLCR